MAVLDSSNDEIVIRVVYDGPPEAGKTTSVRALATSFSQNTVTPEENSTGRTQWFDWMEYVGGRFEGSQIRCQIVSVPGQRELGRRRQALLESADVIVFVGDTTRARWDVTLEYLLELRSLRESASAPVGIVFQANKRDAADSISIGELRKSLGDARWDIGVVESVALDGQGIRESFVYAVRLALDRVRELVAANALPTGRPEQLSPTDLLNKLQKIEEEAKRPVPVAATIEDSLLEAVISESAAAIDDHWTIVEDVPETPPPPAPPPTVDRNQQSVAATLFQKVLAAEVDAKPSLPAIPAPPKMKSALAHTPQPPDASVPSGAIWPPVEGRAILMEVANIDLAVRRHANGDWSAGLGSGWRLVSKRDAIFDSLDAGRNALVQWARLHAACQSIVSPRRCIVLAATGDNRWRLWQIVRAEESLRDLVERATSEDEPDSILDGLRQTAQLLVDVNERLAEAPCDLPCSLDTVGYCDASGMYIGLMPDASAEPTKPRIPPTALLATELGPTLTHDLAERRADLGRLLQDKPRSTVEGDTILASLQRLLETR